MEAKYPQADFGAYFYVLGQSVGSDHKHHIAPRSLFPELADEPDNLKPLSVREHVEAHRMLAIQIPEANWYPKFIAGNLATSAKGGRIGGRIHKKNGTGIFASGMSAKGGRLGGKIGNREGKAIGGRITGRIHKKNGTGIFAPEHRGKSGRITKEKGIGIFAPGMAAKAGKIGGRIAAENGIGAHAPGMAAKGGRITGRINCHNRWHVKRGVVSPTCELCQMNCG